MKLLFAEPVAPDAAGLHARLREARGDVDLVSAEGGLTMFAAKGLGVPLPNGRHAPVMLAVSPAGDRRPRSRAGSFVGPLARDVASRARHAFIVHDLVTLGLERKALIDVSLLAGAQLPALALEGQRASRGSPEAVREGFGEVFPALPEELLGLGAGIFGHQQGHDQNRRAELAQNKLLLAGWTGLEGDRASRVEGASQECRAVASADESGEAPDIPRSGTGWSAPWTARRAST